VSGTRIVAVDESDQILAEDDTAGRPPNAQGQFTWLLGNLTISSPANNATLPTVARFVEWS